MKNYEEMANSVFCRIEEYENKKKQRMKTVRKNAAALGAVLIAVLAGLTAWRMSLPSTEPAAPDSALNNPTDTTSADTSDDGTIPDNFVCCDYCIYIPPLEIGTPSDVMASDMIGFFIYEGRIYVEYDPGEMAGQVEIGEYIGRTDGSIDEWTDEEGYVDFAGSVSGDFYTVKNFDPRFMLAANVYDDVYLYYINDNGITLDSGADLFEHRLHMKGHVSEVSYMTRYNWYYSTGISEALDPSENSEVESFVNALNRSRFMHTKDIPLTNGATNIYDGLEAYHLYIKLDNGFTVHLRLFNGGYVMFDGMDSVCVKVDTEKFESFVSLLQK